MTAHSLVYAPLYRATQLINERRNGWMEVELVFAEEEGGPTKGYGDSAAYECFQTDPTIDLCLADPMVVAVEGWQHVTDRAAAPRGRILAFLVQRPALWALTTPSTAPELRRQLQPGGTQRKGSVAHRLQQVKTAKFAVLDLGRLCTYDAGSTAYRVMEFMRRANHFRWDERSHVEVERLGDEFAYFSPESARPVDVVVTCDSYAAYYLKSLKDPNVEVFFAWHLSSLIQDIPFTALISRNDLGSSHWKKRAAVRELLREIQLVLDREILNVYDDEVVVESFLKSGEPAIHLALDEGRGQESSTSTGVPEAAEAATNISGAQKGSGQPLGGRDPATSKPFAMMLLNKLRQRSQERGVNGIFPVSVRPDAKWVFKAWRYSFSNIWRVAGDRNITDAQIRQCYKVCIDRKTARYASPGNLYERVMTRLLQVLDELVKSGEEVARIIVTLGAFLLLSANALTKAVWPDSVWVEILGALASPWMILGIILVIDIFAAFRKRLREDSES